MSRTWGLVRDSASLEGQRKRETPVRTFQRVTNTRCDRFLHEMHEHEFYTVGFLVLVKNVMLVNVAMTRSF